jgi:hypothetical protein
MLPKEEQENFLLVLLMNSPLFPALQLAVVTQAENRDVLAIWRLVGTKIVLVLCIVSFIIKIVQYTVRRIQAQSRISAKDAMIAFYEHQLQEASRKEFKSKIYRNT